MRPNPAARDAWIFDLDGTLTVPVHDFDAIRRQLGLAPGLPILEQLDALPGERAAALHEMLEAIELGLAHDARAWPGVAELLRTLRDRDARLGVLTRNLGRLAEITLKVAGLGGLFHPEDVLGRTDAAPKPSPEGIALLLDRWGASPEDAVMVGDYLFDLQAGRSAGAATVLLDPDWDRPWHHLADRVIRRLDLSLLEVPTL